MSLVAFKTWMKESCFPTVKRWAIPFTMGIVVASVCWFILYHRLWNNNHILLCQQSNLLDDIARLNTKVNILQKAYHSTSNQFSGGDY